MADPDYDDTNKGYLMKNYDKHKLKDERDTSSWPNAQGDLNVYGIEFWLNAWTAVIKNGDHKGDKIQQVSIKPKDKDEGEKLAKLIEEKLLNEGFEEPEQPPNDFDDDDVPF